MLLMDLVIIYMMKEVDNLEFKKNHIIVILIVLIIIMLVVIFVKFVSFSNYFKKTDEEFVPMNSDFRHAISNSISTSDNMKLDETVMVAKKSYNFFEKYYNKISAKEIQENWDNFARVVMLKYSENIKSESDIEKYFNENSNEIYLETGIENYEDFKKIIEISVKQANYKKLVLQEMEILDSVAVEDNVTYAILQAKYKGNIVINFNMKVLDSKNDDGVFIIYY